MALQIISVVLFTVFFSEALTLTLTCSDCTDTNVPAGTCPTTANCSSSQCSSVTTNNVVVKSCAAAPCANLSINVGVFRKSSKCCSHTDFCNNPTASDSDNGLSCYTCIDTNCTNTLKCKGVEDQCITVAVGSSGTFKGCASKNLCDNSTLLNSALLNSALLNSALLNSALSQPVLKPSCCGANLCNNAQKMTQGPVLLLVPILSLLFYILDLF